MLLSLPPTGGHLSLSCFLPSFSFVYHATEGHYLLSIIFVSFLRYLVVVVAAAAVAAVATRATFDLGTK